MELKITDITPEHTKRNNKGPSVIAAGKYVESVLHTSDLEAEYMWYGWALREAFLAGITYRVNNEDV